MPSLAQHQEHLRKLRGAQPSTAAPTVNSLTSAYQAKKARNPNYEGVGDILHRRLSSLKIPACALCLQLKDDMNMLGPEGCRENLDLLAKKMHENAQRNRSKFVRFIEWADYQVEGLKRHKQLILESAEECERRFTSTGDSRA